MRDKVSARVHSSDHPENTAPEVAGHKPTGTLRQRLLQFVGLANGDVARILILVAIVMIFGAIAPNFISKASWLALSQTATVVAMLTMLGFSIYDGIVVFDRVDENTRFVTGSKPQMTYSEMANLSLNQVLMRSLNTSITTLLPIASVLVIGAMILGATTLEEYGLALFLGLLTGAYSSLFIATPLLAVLKEREPAYREVRADLAAKRPKNPVAGTGSTDLAPSGANPLAPGSAPRPRRTGKR